jgi:hypothetical protein
MGMSGQLHVPAALYPRGKDPDTYWTGDWLDLRAGLDTGVRGKWKNKFNTTFETIFSVVGGSAEPTNIFVHGTKVCGKKTAKVSVL